MSAVETIGTVAAREGAGESQRVRHTLPLGFGCSQLLGPNSRAEAIRLLSVAFESGIRHFDVARSYGFGDAEGVLGEFLRGKRDRVTVTSKFGIRPAKLLARQRLLLQGARRLMKIAPVVRRALGRSGAKLVQRGLFSVEQAALSLEASLRELRTEHIDVYLLHDCTPIDCDQPALLEFLDAAVRSGKIGTFGVGTDVCSVSTIVQSRPAFARVVQFENGVVRQNLKQLEGCEQRTTLTHGPFFGYRTIQSYLLAHPRRAEAWADALGGDCRDSRVLASLMLGYAIHANQRGLVLFSSTHRDNIERNASMSADKPLAPTRLAEFAKLIAESTFQSKTVATEPNGRGACVT
jgi:diketogulonate reductase-like aldo/keto reductase